MAAAAPNGNGYVSRSSLTAGISFAGLLFVALSAFFGFVITSLNARMAELKEAQAVFISRPEHAEFRDRLKEAIERNGSEISLLRTDRVQIISAVAETKRLDAVLVEFKRQVEATFSRLDILRADEHKLVVPRDELTSRLGYIEGNFALLSGRINELRASLTAPYPVREQIDRLTTELAEQRRATSAEITELRRQLSERKP